MCDTESYESISTPVEVRRSFSQSDDKCRHRHDSAFDSSGYSVATASRRWQLSVVRKIGDRSSNNKR